MRAGLRAVLIAMCGLGLGCQTEHADMTGHGPPEPTPKDVLAGDVGADLFTSTPLPKDVSAATTAGQSKLVTIAQGNVNFSVLFGGCEGNVVNAGQGKGKVVSNSDPAWVVEEGYAVGWGWRPFIKTTQVVTGSDGTTVVVQIVNKGADTETHRVFLVRGGPTEVKVQPGTAPRCDADDEVADQTELLLEPWTFVECTIQKFGDAACYRLSDVKQLSTPANRELRKFVRDALRARRAQTLVQQ